MYDLDFLYRFRMNFVFLKYIKVVIHIIKSRERHNFSGVLIPFQGVKVYDMSSKKRITFIARDTSR